MDLGKLTVPQLKALCKERRITGYSKLNKAALLQRLAETAPAARIQTGSSATTEPITLGCTNIESQSTPHHDQNTARQPMPQSVPANAGVTNSTRSSESTAQVPTEPSKSPQVGDATATSTTNTQKPSVTERPAHTDISASPKRTKIVTFTTTSGPVRQSVSANDNSGPISTSAANAPSEPPRSLQVGDATATCTTSTQKPSVTKRPAHTDISGSPKRIRTSTTTSSASHARPPPTSTSQQTRLPVPGRDSTFKVPVVPARPNTLSSTCSVAKHQTPGTCTRPVVPRQVTDGPGRFKPLVPCRPEPGKANGDRSRVTTISNTSKGVDSALVLASPARSPLVLSQIAFPPKLSERKWVYRWAIILSALSPEDRQTCTLVSRTFRYAGKEAPCEADASALRHYASFFMAVYLSAIHILSKDYPGRRLDTLLEQYPRNMTNFWPYLRFRMAEVSERRQAFQQSFLGKYTASIGSVDLLSDRLWTSPDDDKQVEIALRFVLTRMWFAASVGAYGHDASAWSRCIIRDVREIVRGDVWYIAVVERGDGFDASYSFYVLEATCEVVGRPPPSGNPWSSKLPRMGESTSALGYDLRTDWTAWISERSNSSASERHSSLLECVTWSNTEDYHRGISKAWLQRIQGQNADSFAKRRVAERYILACVVANGISGQWMSTSAMAQEFAGLPDDHVPFRASKTTGRSMDRVNMYLPAHHHVESIHFTTSKGEALHHAVAIVQTPGREYYIVRDNGMQVGCEEEGMAKVWQEILGCNIVGCGQ